MHHVLKPSAQAVRDCVTCAGVAYQIPDPNDLFLLQSLEFGITSGRSGPAASSRMDDVRSTDERGEIASLPAMMGFPKRERMT